MDVQLTDPLESRPNLQAELLHDKNSPSDGSSFDKRENPSDIHQMTFISEQEALNKSTGEIQSLVRAQSQPQSQLEELSPNFQTFYKAVMMVTLGISTPFLLWSLFTFESEFKTYSLEGISFMLEGLVVIQSVFAYQGFINKDLQDIKHAFNTMKSTLLWVGIYLVMPLKPEWVKEGNFEFLYFTCGVLMMGFYVFLVVLPTRRVKNIFKLALPKKSRRLAQDLNPARQLDSATFIICQYMHLIAALLGVKYLIVYIFEDFSQENLEKMMSEWRFFATVITRYCLFLLFISFSFFVFEGIRRKNLKKIEISLTLMLTYFIGFLLSSIMEAVGLENGQIVWKYERILIGFGKEQVVLSCFVAVCFFGVLGAEGILKDQRKLEESKRLL